MKTPTWESSPGAGAAFLLSVTGRGAASKGAVRDVYTITLRDSTVVRWTSHTSDLVLGARTFLARTAGGTIPLITRQGSRCVAGLGEVGALSVNLRCDATTTWGGVPLPLAVLDGVFNGATLALERVLLTAPGLVPVAAYAVFAGYVEAQPTTTSVTLSVESIAARLGRISVPRGIVQERCLDQLGDGACGVNLATFTFTGTASSGSSSVSVRTSLAQAAGYFDRAVITFTSGVCAGERRMVLRHTSDWGVVALALARPLPEAPAAGDTFSIVRACAKTPGECDGVFANRPRFRGYPYVPTGTEAEGI
jgi:uncharacterized phage protein (TIGR02218 family)